MIGAGIIGAACAEALSRAGMSVLLLDSGSAGGGTTSVGGGMLSLQAKRPGAHLRLGLRSLRLTGEFASRSRSDFGLQWCGGLVLAATEAEAASLRERSTAAAADGLQVEMLDAAAVREAEPALSPAIILASRCAAEGQLDSRRYCAALVAAAVRSGAELREETPALEVLREGGRAAGVRLPGERVTTGAVVVTAGVRSGDLLREALPAWPVKPRRGVLLHSAPQPPLARHTLIDAAYTQVKESAPRSSTAFTLQQLPAGELVLGGTRSFDPGNHDPTPEEIRAIVERACAYLPEIRQIAFERAAAGLRPWSPDGLPLVGRTELPGLFLAAGHEGDGVALAAVTAEVVAAHASGSPLQPDSDALDPLRFR